MTGLVQRLDPPDTRRYRRGRDGRPHREPVRYQVYMTPRLTKADAAIIHARLEALLESKATLPEALEALLTVDDTSELLTSPETTPPSVLSDLGCYTVMDIARKLTGDALSPEADKLAQELHRKIVNSLGDIHLTHYFITQVIPQYRLTPAQAWLVAVARDLAYLNWRTGERRETVTFKGGYREMATLVRSSRPKTVQAWFNPEWKSERRAGYPYDSPGEFYAAAIRDFSLFLAVGGLLAGALAAMGVLVAAPIVALIFVLLGLRRPYVRLQTLAKKRAESLRNNMLIGLSVLSALLSSGVGVQEALRRSASVGGPICNLLGLLVARMEVDDFGKAIEVTRAHLPDLSDVEANLFLRDIQDFFANNRPVLSSVQGLQELVHRSVVELTEARAALVRQRSGLFGVLAVVGLVLAIIAPFMGAGLI